jgi:hypothetical protein
MHKHRGTPEPHHQNADAPIDAVNEWLLKEMGEFVGRVLPALRLLQLLPGSSLIASNAGSGSRDHRSHLGDQGIVGICTIKAVCAVRRELTIDFAELNHIEVKCACGTQVTLDMSTETNTPGACPGCRKDFSGFANTMRSFRGALQASKIENTPAIRFRIPFEG